MDIDKNAPLIAKKEIIIKAPIEKVWKIQTDINSWPEWQKEVSSAKLIGGLKKGSTIKWRAMGMGISSTIEDVSKHKVIGWSGKSIGMYAIHFWYFEKSGYKTKVKTEESLSGWAPKLIKQFKPNFLDESLQKTLNQLKNQIEKANES